MSKYFCKCKLSFNSELDLKRHQRGPDCALLNPKPKELSSAEIKLLQLFLEKGTGNETFEILKRGIEQDGKTDKYKQELDNWQQLNKIDELLKNELRRVYPQYINNANPTETNNIS